MHPRDSRFPVENDLRPVEIRRGPVDPASAPSTQVWALYPVASPGEGGTPPPSVDLVALLWEAARRGRRYLLIGALVGLAFGATYIVVADPIYVVKTLLHVEMRKSVIRDSDSRPGNTYVGTQAEVLQSPTMIADAIRTIGLPEGEEPGFLGRAIDWVRSLNPFGSEEQVDPIQAAVLAMLPALQASPVVGTDVLAVTLRTPAPVRGVSFLDALVESYQHYMRANESDAQREGLGLLRQREASLDAQIAALSERYVDKESEVRSLGDSENALTVSRMSLEEHARARVEAQRRRIDLENELASLREQASAQVAVSREILDDVVRAEASLAEMRSRLSDRHPDVILAEQRVAGLRQQIQAGTRVRVDQLEREARAARRTEAALAGLYAAEWDKIKALEVERVAMKKLGDERTRLEEERRGVLALMAEKELSVLAAQGGENSGTLVRVLQAPTIPPTAVWPLPIPVLVACSFVGLFGGLGFALYSQWREGVKESEKPTDYEQSASRMTAQRRLQEF
jgi:uncharacterized protein involved in exopolysaccharide biosynthesis